MEVGHTFAPEIRLSRGEVKGISTGKLRTSSHPRHAPSPPLAPETEIPRFQKKTRITHQSTRILLFNSDEEDSALAIFLNAR